MGFAFLGVELNKKVSVLVGIVWCTAAVSGLIVVLRRVALDIEESVKMEADRKEIVARIKAHQAGLDYIQEQALKGAYRNNVDCVKFDFKFAEMMSRYDE